jgi:prevent-host-death family protein
MRRHQAIQVGVRELKNQLTKYLRIAKADREVIVTERGRPVAVIQPLSRSKPLRSLEARIAALAARSEITAPARRLVPRIRRVKLRGRPLSADIVADRR